MNGRSIKKLLLITNRLPVSAEDPASPFVLDFIKALTAAGVETAVYTSHIGEVSADLGFPIHRFDWGETRCTLSELPLMNWSTWQKIKRHFVSGKEGLLKHLENNSYDHILALWALPSGWFAQQAHLATGTPYSVWCLGSDINVWAQRPIAGRMVRDALADATALFADGDELAEKVHRISGRECQFLPSLRQFNYRMLPIPREKFFLYLGRIEKSKGVFDLLRAFAMLKQDIWDYRLLYIGEGSATAKLEKEIERLKVRGKVHLLGRAPIEEVINYLQRARAIVMPTHSDSIPLVFGEALQTATPMVVTNVGDLGTLVRDNKLGYVVQKKSIKALNDALVRSMINDLDISKSAQRLLDRFSPQVAVKTFLEAANAPIE